jgi:hypothetical protein
MDLPVWQALFAELKSHDFMVVAVAEESRGADTARPWIEAAHPGYWCLIDREHRVGDLYGLVNVPQAIWIDEQGRIVRPPESAGSTDDWRISRRKLSAMPDEQRRALGLTGPAAMLPEHAQARAAARVAYMNAVKDWVRTGRHAYAPEEAARRMPAITPEIAEAQARFRLGVWLRGHGREAEGDRQLAEASRLHPESWSMWRQAADLVEIGRSGGADFMARVDALGDKPYYPPPDLPGFGQRPA